MLDTAERVKKIYALWVQLYPEIKEWCQMYKRPYPANSPRYAGYRYEFRWSIHETDPRRSDAIEKWYAVRDILQMRSENELTIQNRDTEGKHIP